MAEASYSGLMRTGQHGLIAAKSDTSYLTIWWGDRYYLLTGATGTAVGTGSANTKRSSQSRGKSTIMLHSCAQTIGAGDMLIGSCHPRTNSISSTNTRAWLEGLSGAVIGVRRSSITPLPGKSTFTTTSRPTPIRTALTGYVACGRSRKAGQVQTPCSYAVVQN